MSRTVDAAVIDDVGVDGFEVEPVELDEPKSNEVRIDVEYAGACHTDWHAVEGDLPSEHYPVIGGHEGAGVVAEVGDEVDRVDVGDQVITVWVPACGECDMCVQGHQNLCEEGGEHLVQGHLPDGTFRFHRDGEDVGQYLLLGTFAEEIVVPETAVVPVPEEMPLDKASIVGCGVTTGFGSAAYRADIQPDDTVVVIGVGNVGLNAVQGAEKSGAGDIVAVDPIEFKRDTAREFGATHTVDPESEEPATFVDDLTDGKGAETAVFTVGVGDGEMIGQAYETLGKRGEVVVTATAPDEKIDVPPVDLILTEKEVKGCLYGGASPLYSCERIIDMYLNDQYMLDELVTEAYDLSEINEAYDNLLDGNDIHSVLKL